MSAFSRVAKMGTNNSKYGDQRNEFEKGDYVAVRNLDGEIYTRGVVVKANEREVIFTVTTQDGHKIKMACNPRFVEAL